MSFTFETVDVKTALVTVLKKELQDLGYGSVRVIRSDPASQAEMPCVAINRANDDESNQTMGDAQGTHYDKASKQYYTYQGTFFQEAMEIRVWHTNADERDKLYLAIKAVLFAVRQSLVEKGLINISLRGGRDEQDTTMQHAPVALYWSTINMEYLNPLNVEIVEIIEPITAIYDEGVLF